LLASSADGSAAERLYGFTNMLESSVTSVPEANASASFDVVAYVPHIGDAAQSAEQVRKVLARYPDLACFVAMNGRHAATIIRVLKDHDRLGQVKLIAFDQSAATLEAVQSGDIDAAIAHNPYDLGYEAIARLAAFARESSLGRPIAGKGFVHLPSQAVRRQNVAAYRDKLRVEQLRATVAAQHAI